MRLSLRALPRLPIIRARVELGNTGTRARAVMSDFGELFTLLSEGETWRAAESLAGLSEAQHRALSDRLFGEAERDRVRDILSDLLETPEVPAGTSEREMLLRLEGMKMLAAAIAHAAAEEDWRDLMQAVRVLSSDSSLRVRESAVRLIARIASGSFGETLPFWQECLASSDAVLAAAVLRGLAASNAPVSEVLRLFSAMMSDIRKDVRHSLGARAIPELGRREPQAVFARLKGWAHETCEITRWNVAQALVTPFGGVYAEDAMDILADFALDERPAVWRAAAAAIVQIAQRRPAYVLPILKRWREEPLRRRCAELALVTLVRR